MNRRFLTCLSFGLFGALASMCLGQDEGQSKETPAALPALAAPPAPAHPPGHHGFEFRTDDNFWVPGTRFGAAFVVPDSEWSKVEKLTNELGDATDEKQKAGLTEKLKAAVDKCFEDDMKGREADLTKLQERLNKLKSQMDRRRKAKDEIVQLEVKVLVNEASGLGFSSSTTSKVRKIIKRRISKDRGGEVINLDMSP
jgi:hypothetical protein